MGLTKKDFETMVLFGMFVFSAALFWHCLREFVHGQSTGARLYHVRIDGGGIVYRDYWTTNPPVTHRGPSVPWFECLTNVTARGVTVQGVSK